MVHFYEQVEKFKEMAMPLLSWVFDPGDAFTVNPKWEIDPGLARINRLALNNSDVVVAFLPRGVASIGVPMEIDRARAQGKPVLVFTDTRSYMLSMTGVDLIGGYDDDDLESGVKWLEEQERFDPGHSGYFGEIRWVGDEEFQPRAGYADDAGLDLIVSEDTVIPPGEFRDVPCGVSVELPERTWAMITGRSSTLRKRRLLVSTGIIDTGYRGPLFAGVWNQDERLQVKVSKGDRIAQLILFANLTMRYPMVRADALNPSERGVAGFGSTGA
jgi:dUTP pyrophosphatase